MPLTHHPLVKEFSSHKEQIHNLKLTDKHFSNLMEKYEVLDKEIYRFESGTDATSDEHLEELKVERVALKDTLYKSIISA